MLTTDRAQRKQFELELKCGPIHSLLGRFNKSKARGIVKKNGVAVIKNAFSTTDLTELFSNIEFYRAEALRAIYGGGEPQLHRKYYFNKATMAAMFSAIDPLTSDYGKENTLDTSLFRAMRAGRGWSAITSIISEDAHFHGARVRVVDHRGGSVKDRRGAVFFHQEKWAIRAMNKPLGHNMWMCLNPDGKVANLATPGLQFALGRRKFWRQDHSADYESAVRRRINRLNRFARDTVDCRDEFVEAGKHVLYRPHLHVGDVVIFDHHIPHGSFIPSSAVSARVSCELRVFPRAEVSDQSHE